jgi:hypothetical protein
MSFTERAGHPAYWVTFTIVTGGIAACVLYFLALSLELWVVAEYPDRVATRVGLVSTCEGANCVEAEYSPLSICQRFGTDVSTRFNAIIAFLTLGGVATGLSALVALRDLCLIRPMAGKGFLQPDQLEHAALLVERAGVPGVMLLANIVAVVFPAAALAIADIVFSSWINCGAHICETFKRNSASGATCTFGASRFVAIAALAVTCWTFLFAVVFAIIMHRLRKAIPPHVRVQIEQAGPIAEGGLAQRAPRPERAERHPDEGQLPIPEVKYVSVAGDDDGPTAARGGRQRGPSQSTLVPMTTGTGAGGDSSRVDVQDASSSAPYGEGVESRSVDPAAFESVEDLDTENNNNALPPGNWTHSERTLYWSEEEHLFYDAASRNYYDPSSDLWYNTKEDRWFHLDEHGKAWPAEEPSSADGHHRTPGRSPAHGH